LFHAVVLPLCSFVGPLRVAILGMERSLLYLRHFTLQFPASGEIHPYELGISAGGKPYISIGDGDGGDSTRTDNCDSLSTGEWHHILGTADGEALRIYIDTEEQTAAADYYSRSISNNNASLYIGEWGPGGDYNPFHGMINEVAVYSNALTIREIVERYFSRSEAEERLEGLVAHWKFKEGKGAGLYDSSTNANHGVIYNLNWTNGGKWQKNDALWFDRDLDHYLCIPKDSSLNITQAISLEVWIKFEITNDAQQIIAKHSAPQSDTTPWTMSLRDDGRLSFIWYQKNPYFYNQVKSQGGLETGVWHHVVATVDETELRLYMNGELDAGPVTRTAMPGTNDVDLYFGRWGPGG